MNSLFASRALAKEFSGTDDLEIFKALSKEGNHALRAKVKAFAEENGMESIDDSSGTNIDVQVFDTFSFGDRACCYSFDGEHQDTAPVLIVMDYAFGEQAFETIDELLKPYGPAGQDPVFLDIVSLSIMGKAGILEGGKGDIMIPSAHIFEGTADNYPFHNELCAENFHEDGLNVFEALWSPYWAPLYKTGTSSSSSTSPLGTSLVWRWKGCIIKRPSSRPPRYARVSGRMLKCAMPIMHLTIPWRPVVPWPQEVWALQGYDLPI